jgi:Zn ribbon nucleic-acid-binding protein
MHVCPDCFEDQALKEFIEDAASATSCDFCGAASDQNIAAPLIDVFLRMNESLERKYDIAE